MSNKTEAFRKELAALCKKYDCTIEIVGYLRGYLESESMKMEVDFRAAYSTKPPSKQEKLDLGFFFGTQES